MTSAAAFALPACTPAVVAYPNLAIDSTQFQKNNFLPRKRTFGRTLSAQETEPALKGILRKYWGHNGFRGPQLEICLASLKEMDLMVVAPTGLGKSLCFQLPAIASEHGVTLVVTPLKALMKDQVRSLRAKNIPCGMVCEETSLEEIRRIKRDLVSSHPTRRILYLTPETLFGNKLTSELRAAYEKKEIRRMVIDEAHTIEEWGMTFRPTYRDLGKFREKFPRVPITALTASATEEVREDICALLGIQRKSLAQWVEPFNRKNLFYEVRYRGGSGERADRGADIADYILRYRADAHQRNIENGINAKCVTGIVYCGTKGCCDLVAKTLNAAGISAETYYAGQKERELDNARISWQNGLTECIVATIAFGMGIDQPHVRYVIHYDMPKSFEGFYQETGRAGRDGHLSRCLLYYSRENATFQRGRLGQQPKNGARAAALATTDAEAQEQAKLRSLNSFKWLQNEYAEKMECRHIQICRYFGEEIDVRDPSIRKAYCGGMCDVCVDKGAVMRNSMAISEDIDLPSQIVRPPKRALPEEPASSDTADASLDLLAGTVDTDSDGRNDSGHSLRLRLSMRAIGDASKPNGRSRAADHRSSPLVTPRPRVPFGARPSNVGAGPSRFKVPKIRNYTSEEGGYAEIGAPPDGDKNSEKKRKAQEAAFQGVEPVKDEGPYQYYNQSPLPGRVSSTAKFKTPFKTPLLIEKGKGRVGPIMLSTRKEELNALQVHLIKTLTETPFAERLWGTWSPNGVDENKRIKAIKKAAKAMEEAVVVECGTQEIFRASMADVRKTFRLLRIEDGVRIIERGELDTHFKKDKEAVWLRILDAHLRG